MLIYFIDLIDGRKINERIMKWSSIDSYKISRLISFITELLITERISDFVNIPNSILTFLSFVLIRPVGTFMARKNAAILLQTHSLLRLSQGHASDKTTANNRTIGKTLTLFSRKIKSLIRFPSLSTAHKKELKKR